jgi:hypothetical protein
MLLIVRKNRSQKGGCELSRDHVWGLLESLLPPHLATLRLVVGFLADVDPVAIPLAHLVKVTAVDIFASDGPMARVPVPYTELLTRLMAEPRIRVRAHKQTERKRAGFLRYFLSCVSRGSKLDWRAQVPGVTEVSLSASGGWKKKGGMRMGTDGAPRRPSQHVGAARSSFARILRQRSAGSLKASLNPEWTSVFEQLSKDKHKLTGNRLTQDEVKMLLLKLGPDLVQAHTAGRWSLPL